MDKKILVIGDSCRDIFIYCEAERLCPDIPVPVLNIVNEVENAGMAKNVQRNIQSLIKECDIVTNDNWYNITKTRYMHKRTNHMFFRIDVNQHDVPRINIKDLNLDYKIVVVSDYNKGFLKEEDIEYICSSHPTVFLDTKKNISKFANNALYIKINHHEYTCSKPTLTKELENKIIVTEGDKGCLFREKMYPVKKVQVWDLSGAGDSFMAGLVCKYYETNDIETSITFANKCASKVVQERGVSII
jgi:bifunctional ADP-heptose synthase (sugar kinase/adenylyltransferase)